MPEEIENLRKIIRHFLRPLREVPFYLVVESLFEQNVIPYDGVARDSLQAAVDEAGRLINASGVKAARPNEVGNYLEPFVEAGLRARDFKADTPKTRDGKRRSAGYPDIEATKEGKTFYVEVKSYNPDSADTSFRSFYLSPSQDPKVCRNGYHLVFAFAAHKSSDGLFRVVGCKVLDIRNLLCDVKYEFNSNNRRLYAKEAGLLIFERQFKLPRNVK